MLLKKKFEFLMTYCTTRNLLSRSTNIGQLLFSMSTHQHFKNNPLLPFKDKGRLSHIELLSTMLCCETTYKCLADKKMNGKHQYIT